MSEHLKQIKAGNNNSPMVEHQQEEHEGVPSSFKLELVKSTPKPLERQVLEGQLIRNPKPEVKLMNRKGEWGQNLPQKFSDESEGQNQVKTATRSIKTGAVK